MNPLMGWESSTDTLQEIKIEFETKEQVFKHIKKFHPKEIFQCDNDGCKKQFFTLHELQVHDHQKTHCCYICDYRAESLEIHNNVMHLARKDFQCKKSKM